MERDGKTGFIFSCTSSPATPLLPFYILLPRSPAPVLGKFEVGPRAAWNNERLAAGGLERVEGKGMKSQVGGWAEAFDQLLCSGLYPVPQASFFFFFFSSTGV
jgi:hypothetical protein